MKINNQNIIIISSKLFTEQPVKVRGFLFDLGRYNRVCYISIRDNFFVKDFIKTRVVFFAKLENITLLNLYKILSFSRLEIIKIINSKLIKFLYKNIVNSFYPHPVLWFFNIDTIIPIRLVRGKVYILDSIDLRFGNLEDNELFFTSILFKARKTAIICPLLKKASDKLFCLDALDIDSGIKKVADVTGLL